MRKRSRLKGSLYCDKSTVSQAGNGRESSSTRKGRSGFLRRRLRARKVSPFTFPGAEPAASARRRSRNVSSGSFRITQSTSSWCLRISRSMTVAWTPNTATPAPGSAPLTVSTRCMSASKLGVDIATTQRSGRSARRDRTRWGKEIKEAGQSKIAGLWPSSLVIAAR